MPQADCLIQSKDTMNIEMYHYDCETDERWIKRRFCVAKKDLEDIIKFLEDKEDSIFTPFYNSGYEKRPIMSRKEALLNVNKESSGAKP